MLPKFCKESGWMLHRQLSCLLICMCKSRILRQEWSCLEWINSESKDTPAVKFVQMQGKNTLCFVQSEDTFRTQSPRKWNNCCKDTHCTKRNGFKVEFSTRGKEVPSQEYSSPLPTVPLICNSTLHYIQYLRSPFFQRFLIHNCSPLGTKPGGCDSLRQD